MATYYVRPDGNDANTGLGSSASQAWQTITKAVGATGIASGDTLYVAPGTYRSATGFTISTAYTSATQILADPTAAQFSGIQAGPVRLSVFTPTDTSAGTSSAVLSGTTNNLLVQGFEIHGFTGSGINITATTSTIIERCVCFGSTSTNTMGIQITPGGNNTSSTKLQVRNCIVVGFFGGININGPFGTAMAVFSDLYENLCIGQQAGGVGVSNVFSSATPTYGSTTNIYNNVVIGNNGLGIIGSSYASPAICNIVNNLVMNCATGLRGVSSTLTLATNNRIINCTVSTNAVTLVSGNSSNGIPGIDVGQGLLHGLTALQFCGSHLGSPNTSFGITGLSALDLFNIAWSGTSPDAGAITYRPLATITPIYQPTERNSSSLSISSDSTSQSVELYLGVTGLTASTSGLSAYYNRSRTSPVQINLVARTIAQPWISGGFAEVDSVNMPGIYRLDIPNAALVSGASDVTITVRGASGTNGAVLTIKLQTIAAEVWNADRNQYNNPNTFGARVVQTTEDNRDVNVTAGNQIQIDNEQTFYPTVGQNLDAITEDVGRWTLRNNVLTLYAPDGTYIRRVRLSALGIAL